MPDWLFWTIGSTIAASGLILLTWSLFWDRSRSRRRCPKCWYDMSGVPTLQCPECGKSAKAENKFFKTRRRWQWAALACVLLIAGGGVAGTPKLKRDGPFALVPTPMLNFAASFFDEQANQLYEWFDDKSDYQSQPILSAWEQLLLARSCRIKLDELIAEHELPLDERQSLLSDVASRALEAGDSSRLVIPSLRNVITDPHHPLLDEAIYSVGAIGLLRGPIGGIVPVLVERIEEQREQNEYGYGAHYLWALVVNDPTGESSVPLLASIVESDVEPSWKERAITCLGWCIEKNERAGQVISQFLDTGAPNALSVELYVHAIAVLREAGPLAEPAIPSLERFKARHPQLKWQIDDAISAIRSNP